MTNQMDIALEGFMKELIFDDYPGTNSSASEAARWPEGLLGSWPTMGSIMPSVFVTALYLILVLRLMPSFMKKQKAPYELTIAMTAYNIAQMIFSFWLLHLFFYPWSNVVYFVNAITNPANHELDAQTEYLFSCIAWYYLMCKYVEFLDTIFFVLRGKENQVSFLHVYHHTNMALSTWLYVRYVRPSHLMPIVIANSAVHFLMYGYYMLAAMGPAVRPYLWWKRYITRIQLIQFVVILLYMLAAVYYKCPVQKFYFAYTIVNTSSFLILFFHFYIKTYTKSIKREKLMSNGHSNDQVPKHTSGLANGHVNGTVASNRKQVKAE